MEMSEEHQNLYAYVPAALQKDDSSGQQGSMSRIMNESFTESVENINSNSSAELVGVGDGIFNTSNYDSTEYIFDRTDVRAIFLTLYTIVFCSCFFGNLMVILVVTLHWRMRSITNFCLANLAFADLCVGIFCVYQNIINYTLDSWIFGEFMCKMYHFISSLSTTASILILVVICIERYLAIIHPMRCKQMLTLNRLRLTIVGVWIISAIISSPRFYYFGTMSMPLPEGKVEILCLPNRLKYNSKTVDMISMVLLFLLPLLVITILYFRIGVSLWKSSTANMNSASSTSAESSSSSRCDSNVGNLQNSSTPSPALCRGERKKSIFHPLSCLNCKGRSRKRHRRSSGSFYGGDRLGYAPVNLTTMNGQGNGNITRSNGATRNTNGLIISCSGNSSLHPIKSSLQSPNVCQSITQTHQETSLHLHHPLQCCNCASTSASRGTESVPVSPYLKRDSTPLSSPAPTAISTTDPIVLVKFEKKSSLRKCKRNQCTILMRSAISATTLNDDNSNYDTDKGMCTTSSRNCNQVVNESRPGHGKGIITFSSDLERCGNSCCSCNGPTASCQICGQNEGEDNMRNPGIQHDPYTGLGHTSYSASTLDGGCDRNLDCNSHSRLMSKDSIHHLPYSHGHHCPSPCQSVGGGNPSANLKGINPTSTSTKGPKRMRVIRSSKYGTRALQCRRRIIRMLIVIVFVFAVCHLPFHARKIWTYWGKSFDAVGVFSSLFTPITSLIMYAQSGINPILYAFMSRKFRNSFADLLCCNMRRSLKISRNFSVRSNNTNAIQLSQAA